MCVQLLGSIGILAAMAAAPPRTPILVDGVRLAPLEVARAERAGRSDAGFTARPSQRGRLLDPRLARLAAAVAVSPLAAEGTQEAIPGLLEALAAERFRPPSAQAPYRLAWIAALAIAARDPWAEIDAWLAGMAARTETLVEGPPDAPELGATAAGLLLVRHAQDPNRFGLTLVSDPVLVGAGLSGYRFLAPEGRAKVGRWWTEHRAAAQPGPGVTQR